MKPPLISYIPYLGWSQLKRMAYRDGVSMISTSAITISSWGFVTGLVMGKSSLSFSEAIFMSLAVYAGTGQLAVLPLITGGFSVITVLLTALVVNLRFIIFSIGMQSHFLHLPLFKRCILGYFNADFSYLMFNKRYAETLLPSEYQSDKATQKTFFMIGLTSGGWTYWQVGSILGILLSSQVPNSWGLEFAGTLALIAIIVPSIENTAARWISVVAALVGVAAYSLPYKLNLTFAILAAIALAIAFDRIPKTKEKQ
ncbi:MAG: AzlC family ABC transporter permease [Polynucleobacter sp.]|jgi:predicted branched-subunit amino acid permease|nr:AzlC family ABC transporter permease [Polynucleobacter sp.]